MSTSPSNTAGHAASLVEATEKATATTDVALRLFTHVPPSLVFNDLVEQQQRCTYLEGSVNATTTNLAEAQEKVRKLQNERQVWPPCALLSCRQCLFFVFSIACLCPMQDIVETCEVNQTCCP